VKHDDLRTVIAWTNWRSCRYCQVTLTLLLIIARITNEWKLKHIQVSYRNRWSLASKKSI